MAPLLLVIGVKGLRRSILEENRSILLKGILMQLSHSLSMDDALFFCHGWILEI
jgi:hypothetical protein